MSDLGNKQIFARNLNHQMSKCGIDRVQLCDALGFKYSTVSEWLSAKKYPRIDKIEMLADYFGIKKSDLIEERQDVATASESVTTSSPELDRLLAAARQLSPEKLHTLVQVAEGML